MLRSTEHYKDIYNIVNSNYNNYGNSVLNPHRDCSSYSRSSTVHSTQSIISNSSKRTLTSDYSKKKPKFNYRSLLLQESLSVKKLLNRFDNDTFSVFSSLSRSAPPTINNLPMEVMKSILSYVDDYRTVVCCFYVNKHFNKAAKIVLYEGPILTSTYRLAQLVSSLRDNPELGQLVKILDLSKLHSGLLTDNDDGTIPSENEDDNYLDYALASWRDWKFKDDPLYGSSLLNSYNLSKSKSTVSVDSLSTVTSMRLRLFKKFRDESHLGDFHLIRFKNISKLFKLKRNSSTTASQLKAKISSNQSTSERKLNSTETPSNQKNHEIRLNNGKIVQFSFRDPKNQPFTEPHPYTNKFLLKYSGSKDIPIGHLLHLLDLCPNLRKLDLSSISLSTEFKLIDYPKTKAETIPRLRSLVEEVLPKNQSDSDFVVSIRNGLSKKSTTVKSGSPRPIYMSDLNSYFNIKNFHEQFVKVSEDDVLSKISNLKYLTELKLSSVTWINYKSLKKLFDTAQFILFDSLQAVDLSNSGMVKDLRWAKKFDKIEDFKSYFKEEKEPIITEDDDESAIFLRTIGMNY